MRPSIRQSHRGFTLMELMVAVVVVGVLAAAAYPAMTSMVKRSRRADAIAALTAVVQAQERYRSNNATYAQTIDVLKIDADKAYKYYELGLAVGEAGSFASGYTVTATPKSSGPQTSDKDCATMSVQLKGSLFTYVAKDSVGEDSVAKCWGR
jgi:type IV pilus assembly protein PilE